MHCSTECYNATNASALKNCWAKHIVKLNVSIERGVEVVSSLLSIRRANPAEQYRNLFLLGTLRHRQLSKLHLIHQQSLLYRRQFNNVDEHCSRPLHSNPKLAKNMGMQAIFQALFLGAFVPVYHALHMTAEQHLYQTYHEVSVACYSLLQACIRISNQLGHCLHSSMMGPSPCT